MSDFDLKSSESFLLFALPSFTEGVSRVLDLGATLEVYNEATSDAEADALALKADWMMVGRDFHSALRAIRANTDVEKTSAPA